MQVTAVMDQCCKWDSVGDCTEIRCNWRHPVAKHHFDSNTVFDTEHFEHSLLELLPSGKRFQTLKQDKYTEKLVSSKSLYILKNVPTLQTF